MKHSKDLGEGLDTHHRSRKQLNTLIYNFECFKNSINFIFFYMLNFQGAHLPKTDKRNNKTSNEPIVIDETLIL